MLKLCVNLIFISIWYCRSINYDKTDYDRNHKNDDYIVKSKQIKCIDQCYPFFPNHWIFARKNSQSLSFAIFPKWPEKGLILLCVFQLLSFLFLNWFLWCDHSLESSCRDDSTEWSQHRIQLRLKEISQKM